MPTKNELIKENEELKGKVKSLILRILPQPDKEDSPNTISPFDLEIKINRLRAKLTDFNYSKKKAEKFPEVHGDSLANFKKQLNSELQSFGSLKVE